MLGQLSLLTAAVAAEYTYTLEELSGAHYAVAIKLGVEEDHDDVLEGLLKLNVEEKGIPIEKLCTCQTNIFHYADYFPMHYAALLDRDTHLAILAKAGCGVDSEAPSGIRPLHAAAEHGSLNSIKALLELGADPLKTAHEMVVRNNDAAHRGFDGQTAATLAAEHGKLDILKHLKEVGGDAAKSLVQRDLNGKMGPEGWSPIQYALHMGERVVWKWLLFEVGWSIADKEEVVNSAKDSEASEIRALSSLNDAEMEKARQKWLNDLAKANEL